MSGSAYCLCWRPSRSRPMGRIVRPHRLRATRCRRAASGRPSGSELRARLDARKAPGYDESAKVLAQIGVLRPTRDHYARNGRRVMPYLVVPHQVETDRATIWLGALDEVVPADQLTLQVG